MRSNFIRLKLPLYLILTGFALWMVAATALLRAMGGSRMAMLGWTLLASIVTASFGRFFPRAGLLVAGVAVIIYAALGVLESIPAGRNYFTAIFVGALCFVVTGVLASSLQDEVHRLEEELRMQRALIGELTVRDNVSGAIKWQYARQLLTEEIERSRRYNYSLSLALVGIEDWASVVERVGREEAREVLARAGETLVRSLRNVDKVARYGASEFALLLPSTPLGGAEVAVARASAEVMRRTQLLVRAGIAHFPSGATSSQELVAEAEAALRMARAAGLPIASQSLLGKQAPGGEEHLPS